MPRESTTVDKFAEALGLKTISLENIMKNSTRSDEVVEETMNHDANFIKTQEGYPLFYRDQQDSLSKVKFNTYSNEIGLLDFYESLIIIPKVYSSLNILFEDFQKELKPANASQHIAFNIIFLEKAYAEFKRSIAFSQDELIEYPGSKYIENDIIMSSSDKLMFLIKDMVAHIGRTFKKNLNPFFVAKLDLYSVHYFPFPDVLKEDYKKIKFLK